MSVFPYEYHCCNGEFDPHTLHCGILVAHSVGVELLCVRATIPDKGHPVEIFRSQLGLLTNGHQWPAGPDKFTPRHKRNMGDQIENKYDCRKLVLNNKFVST